MNKLIIAFALTIASGIFASAQSSDDYKKGEFFAGYSHGQVDDSTGRFMTSRSLRETGAARFNGFNVSGVYNVSRYVGIKGDFSGTYNGGDFNIPIGFIAGGSVALTGNSRNSLYNFLGGVQFKDNSSERRVKPFGHVLVGGGHARTEVDARCTPTPNCPTGIFISPRDSETGLAAAFGGGFDIKLNDRFDIRAVQLDYNPIRLDSGTLHNIRIGAGIVIK